MDQILGKVTQLGRGITFKTVISDTTIFSLTIPDDNCVQYSPEHNLDEENWFVLNEFSTKEYCLDILRSDINSTRFRTLERSEIGKIEYIISYQNSNEFHFQRVQKATVINRKFISLGDEFKVVEGSKRIIINDFPDALYVKDKDLLYFKKLSSITSIFKGIDSLYREATDAEIVEFLSKDFLIVDEQFTYNHVKIPNRKRIALALEQLNSFEEEQKTVIFESIKEYCPDLLSSNGKFNVNNESDLQLLLYGIGQRFYTTPDGREKRIANSIIRI
ncbi:hypothetical protein J4772_31720 [Cohnella sp. LGH]|uniref:hypothetical protein n=1 Tax=Cohnella sp. LGH TaxID=1619153 RepID=UPI001ADD2AA6|nr:hypothetical protein [Cohnella sp. LGH]QTH42031.1 hypothetical protein J4772_31720 [Cohnella sp. LGH]